ncbi:MAG: MAPEG family protein [Alphaproteobacteria bacterium]|nr:MAPEG family protein [Alphaproteobacteria bacterium]
MSAWIVLVTLAALLLYFYMGTLIGAARVKHGIPAPATSGNPDFERVFRVHMNTLEWLPLFLPTLWICAYYWDPRVTALVGCVWIVGRAMYMHGYIAAANQRSMGFLIQAIAVLLLLLGSAAGAVMSLINGA